MRTITPRPASCSAVSMHRTIGRQSACSFLGNVGCKMRIENAILLSSPDVEIEAEIEKIEAENVRVCGTLSTRISNVFTPENFVFVAKNCEINLDCPLVGWSKIQCDDGGSLVEIESDAGAWLFAVSDALLTVTA